MLKRHDLSKQFELVVQQEIKNFQDVSYQINQTLNELRDRIDHLERTTTNNRALLESRNTTLSIELEILKLAHDTTQKRLDSHVNDTSSTVKRIEDHIDFNVKYSIAAHDKNDQAMSAINSLRDSLNAFQTEFKQQSSNIQSTLDLAQFNIKSDLASFKQEILSLPSDSEDIRKEFREKLACHKIDVEGVSKEFRMNRKEFMVIEKKLESIYTLIDNLKKAGATS